MSKPSIVVIGSSNTDMYTTDNDRAVAAFDNVRITPLVGRNRSE